MRSEKGTAESGHITVGDIFDDLGFSPKETLEAKIKSEVLHAIVQHSGRQGWSQAQLARAIGAHQPDVSNLLRGKISKFSITRLIQFAGRLNLEAHIHMMESKAYPEPQKKSPAKRHAALAA
jgi:predicted XRE-type DNA-binding protein